jgi:hypothetical protein
VRHVEDVDALGDDELDHRVVAQGLAGHARRHRADAGDLADPVAVAPVALQPLRVDP